MRGKRHEDFRSAWFHEEGFNAPNRMLSMLNVADPREVIVIGMTAVESAEDGARLIGIDQQQRGESPLDTIIESDIDRTFAVLVAEDDFSAGGSLDYQPAAIDGTTTDLTAVHNAIQLAGSLLAPYLKQQTPQAPESHLTD